MIKVLSGNGSYRPHRQMVSRRNGKVGFLVMVGLLFAALLFTSIQPVYAEDSAAALDAVPGIHLEKSVNATKIHSGETVQYTFNVSNTGDVPLYFVTVVDDTFDFIIDPVIGPITLAPGESSVKLVNVTIGGAGKLTNNATATGIPAGGPPVMDTASVTLTVGADITLVKSVNATLVHSGETVQYTFNVSNTGLLTLFNVTVVDDTFDFIIDPVIGPITLAPGESSVKLVNVTIGGSGKLTNVATATGTPETGFNVTDTDSVTLTVGADISLEKSVNATKIHSGEPVQYTFNVSNTGDETLSNVTVVDDALDFILNPIIGNVTLAPGEFSVKLVNVTIGGCGTLTNNATATGTWGGGLLVTDNDTVTVNVICPAIQVDKTVSVDKAVAGSSVTYTYTVNNLGTTPLYNVTLFDSDLGLLFTGLTLGDGESKVMDVDVVVGANVTNVATVSGIDLLGRTVTDDDSAYVQVIHPVIELTKTCSPDMLPTGTIVWNISVTNVGDVVLTGINVSDTRHGWLGAFSSFAPGEGGFFTIVEHDLPGGTYSDTANVWAAHQLGTVSAEDTAECRVVSSILLDKSVNATTIHGGETVQYTLNVTNISGETLTDVTVVDDTFDFIIDPVIGPITLAPGESSVKLVNVTIGGCGTLTNNATATGILPTGELVEDTDSATVSLVCGDIHLDKSVNATHIHSGDAVQYTLNVTNIGDSTLYDVTVVDDILDFILDPVIGPITLAPGESSVKLVNVTIVGCGTVTNVATATGTPGAGPDLVDTDSVTVTACGDISLDKSVNATTIHSGETVQYTLNVTNIGVDPLYNVTVVDDTLDFILDPVIGPITLAPGESSVKLVNVTIGGCGTLTNVATATGAPDAGTIMTDTDTVTVAISCARIALDKTVSADKAVAGSSVTYTYNTSNIGPVPLDNVTLVDSDLGLIFTGLTLGVGAFNVTTVDVVVGANVTNIATASGVDPLGLQVYDTDSATVIVINPQIELTKTCSPEAQLAPGTITWNVSVTNVGDVVLTGVNVSDTRHGWLGSFGSLSPNGTGWFTIVEDGLSPGMYSDTASVAAHHQLGEVYDEDSAQCEVTPLKHFTGVTVLDGESFEASLVNPKIANVIGLHSGPAVFFNVTYYFENSLTFLGDDFDGQAHNFELWDKWGGNLLVLNSPPVDYNFNNHQLTLANGVKINIDPRKGDYRGELPIILAPSQGTAQITAHTGDQQEKTNPGKGKGKEKSHDGSSYDADIAWMIGEVGVGENATLTVWVAPGMNPGGNEEFSSEGCSLINTGPNVRVYGETYDDEDFLYALSKTSQLEVCASKTSLG